MKKQNILIVDDNRTNVKVLASMLKNKDYNLAVALCGEDAIEIVKSNHIDLILLDIMMPVMDGFEVCRRLKETPKYSEIPIIFITAMVETESIVQGFELGGADYITKPFNEEELLARVKMQLNLSTSKEKIKQQNQLLKKQNDKLNSLNATKNKLFSIIAHDLRGPLSTFPIFFSAMIENNTIPKEQEFLYMEMQQQSENIFSLLENLLKWAMNQQEIYHFKFAPINMGHIIADTVKLLEKSAQKKSITLINNVKETEQVFSDKDIMSLIVRNIISNAIKFTPIDGQIVVSSFAQDDMLGISIKDNGIGMTEEQQQKIFKNDEFYSTYGTENEKGSGLGLTMCNEFIKKCKGKLWVESSPEKGSNFKFTIPITENNV